MNLFFLITKLEVVIMPPMFHLLHKQKGGRSTKQRGQAQRSNMQITRQASR
jgi:hypothetical protein